MERPKFDKAAMRFQAKVMSIAIEHFDASCEGPEAEPFLDKIYENYVKAGSPDNMVGWIKEQLKDEFLSVGEPPRWVEDEPAWPFLEGRPMVFVSQTQLERNDVTENHLTHGQVVYVFGARVHLDRGYRVEYRIVTQRPGIEGTGYR